MQDLYTSNVKTGTVEIKQNNQEYQHFLQICWEMIKKRLHLSTIIITVILRNVNIASQPGNSDI